MTATSAAVTAFREAYINADPQRTILGVDFDAFGRWEARRTRYELYWALYQNNAYQDLLHRFIGHYKEAFGLYKHIRHIYNPAYRLGEFWATHLLGGALDPLAGDGETAQSALPILTDSPQADKLRLAIAQLWRDSYWQTEKEVYTRYGAVCGDVGLRIVDDTISRCVSLQKVHPGTIKWIDRDCPYSPLKSAIIEEWRYDPRERDISQLSPQVDPRSRQLQVRYTEKMFLDGNDVVFQTYLNGDLYPWNGSEAEWREPYGFIPLVIAQHENVGMDWGWNCFHAGLSKFREADDQASLLGDSTRKLVRGKWFFSGIKGPKSLDSNANEKQPQPGNPQPNRTAQDILSTTEINAKVTPLVMPIPVAEILAHITSIIHEIEKDYAELAPELHTSSGDASGRALRVARQRAAAKVQARRPSYDAALVEAQEMAIAIGGFRGYRNYEGFSLESRLNGDLTHRIGHRPVFDTDPMDEIEEDNAFWDGAAVAVKAGMPLRLYLKKIGGWSDEDLKEFDRESGAADAQALANKRKTQAAMLAEPDPAGDQPAEYMQ